MPTFNTIAVGSADEAIIVLEQRNDIRVVVDRKHLAIAPQGSWATHKSGARQRCGRTVQIVVDEKRLATAVAQIMELAWRVLLLAL